MFYSSGYFKHIDCPFLVSGLCERHYCHFRHSNFVKVESYSGQPNDNDISILSYSYGDNYLSTINDSEYNPVDFVSKVKPSYSPACNPTTVSPNKVTQSIQTDTIPVCTSDSVSVESKESLSKPPLEIISKPEDRVEIPKKAALSQMDVKVKKVKSKKQQLDRDLTQESLLIEQKAQKVRDIIKSIFDSSDDSSANEGRSHKIKSKKKRKCEKNGEVFEEDSHRKKKRDRDREPESMKVVVTKQQREKEIPRPSKPVVPDETERFTEMEQALITGRFRGRRLTTIEIFKFRRELADRDGR